MSKILIVEDEESILMALEDDLGNEGYAVTGETDGAQAGGYDLLILDIMLPSLDGLEVCKKLRAAGDATPILILTAKSQELDKVLGLELGADDYVTKPFSRRELLARVKALLRRYRSDSEGYGDSIQILGSCNLSLDRERFILHLEEKDIFLPRKEFELLSLLLTKPGKVFTRTEIYKKVWGEDIIVGDRTIDVHIRKSRL